MCASLKAKEADVQEYDRLKTKWSPEGVICGIDCRHSLSGRTRLRFRRASCHTNNTRKLTKLPFSGMSSRSAGEAHPRTP